MWQMWANSHNTGSKLISDSELRAVNVAFQIQSLTLSSKSATTKTLSFAKGVPMKNNDPKSLRLRLGTNFGVPRASLLRRFATQIERELLRSKSVTRVTDWLTCLGIEAKQQPTPNLETHFRRVLYIITSGGLFTHDGGKTP